MTPSPRSITQLLIEWRSGDQTALDELMPLVYDELRRMARNYMRGERLGHTLQTTALVNELYLRLVDHKDMRWQNRAHFYAVAAQAMRRILVDYARKHRARKRQVELVELDQAAPIADKQPTDLIALDDALVELEKIDPRKSQVVVMKYFGGMTDAETAETLGISTATVTREWQTAKAKLLESMSRANTLARITSDVNPWEIAPKQDEGPFMTPQRWQQIDNLLQTVVDARPDQRTSLLDEACTGDQALREEVESLLHFREMAQSFLETPALEEVASLLVEDRADLMTGLLVDRYRIEQHLGAGSMGEVYLAEDTWLDRKVAIKFLPSLQADEISRKRLVREAKAAARLDHPNICAVYEVNEADSESFIVMQYVAGKTLGETIQDRGLSLSNVLNIGIQILEALAEAHSHGIVHRDIKPGNVMITPRGQVKVLDFGLAKYVGSATLQPHSTGWSDHLSRPGERAGTPFYMSPEQARGVMVDARSDLFAVGIILYQCLTGSLPFSGKTVTEILEQVVHVDPLPASSLNPEVPIKLEAVIIKALTKQLDARYQSATELLQDLNELRATLPQGDTAPGPMPASSYRPLPRSFWNTVSEVSRQPRNLVFAAVPIVVVFILWWSWPPYQPPLEARRRYEAGTLALRNGAYFQASRELEKAVATDAKFALAHARLAEAYAELDLSDKAKDEIIRAQLIADDQRMEESANLYLQAIINTAVREFAKATAAYQKLVAQVPAGERASVFLDLGRSYEKNDDIDKAKESYQQAANLAPQDAVAYLRLGRLYSRREELESALEAFQKAEAAYRAINNLEGAAEVFFERGFLLLNLVRLSEAENNLEVALRMATEAANVSQQIRALLALSSVAVHEGRSADAEAKAKQAIELAQSNGMEYQATGGLAWLGTTFFMRGDKSKAEECYQRSLDLARRNNGRLNEAIALVQLANLMQSQHRTDQVFAYLDQGTAIPSARWISEVALASDADLRTRLSRQRRL